jgi:hypothetical protein
MKKLWIAFAIAMAALMVFAGPAFAYYPPQDGASANVDCDDPDVSDSEPEVGTVVVFSGTVSVNASSYNNKDYWDGWYCGGYYVTGAYAYVSGDAFYTIYDPDGATVASGGDSWSDFDVGDAWFGYPWDEDTSASISEDWYWEASVLLDIVGDYTVENGGEAYAGYGNWVQWYKWVPCGWGGTWVPDGDPAYYAEGDPAYDSCFAARTVTAHSNAALGTARIRPILTIQLPADGIIYEKDHSEQFFTTDGWGDPTTDVIVYSDGIWQVEVPVDTIIHLDGEWHSKTWIEVDDQGNVIGRYGSDGHIIAEEIALSNSITVTKVG